MKTIIKNRFKCKRKRRGFILAEVLMTLTLLVSVTFTSVLLCLTIINNSSEQDSKFQANHSIRGISLDIRNNINGAKSINIEDKKLTLTMLDNSVKIYEITDGDEGYLSLNSEKLVYLIGNDNCFMLENGNLIVADLNVRTKNKNGTFKSTNTVIKVSTRGRGL